MLLYPASSEAELSCSHVRVGLVLVAIWPYYRRQSQAEAYATATSLIANDSGFFLASSRILVTSRRHGAHWFGPGLSGNFDSSALAQIVGAADELARGVHPSGKWASLDGHVYSRHAVPSRQTQVAARSRAAGSFRLLRLPGRFLQPELASSPSRVVAFEPDGEKFHAIFFSGPGRFRCRRAALRSSRGDRNAPSRIAGAVQRLRSARHVAVDFAARSFQPRSGGAHRKLARRAVLRKARRPRNCARPWDKCRKQICFTLTRLTEISART